ncbi:MAG: hypothetical protein OXE59_05365 [Bacteroidetes bacterium]|nr:hypothetical protein [Bacteroidota bacterium]MCY4233154.1 hypothetical protein [Bacteroidota bacterium]
MIEKPLSEYSAKDLNIALQWAKEGADFDHIIDDVPEAAQGWACERIELVRDMFKEQCEVSY